MTIVLLLAGLVAVIIALSLVRACSTPRVAAPASPLAEADLDAAAGVEQALAALVRRATVSLYDAGREDQATFAALIGDLERLFPRVHASLERELVGDRGILYLWEGSDASLAPAILCAHFDVVPADDAPEWRHDPFSGEIAEGSVWGRGTQDIKVTLASSLHAAERLLARGFRPKRSIYFAFGGDEEIGGHRGARRIGELLASRGVHASFLLDEGGPVSDGVLSFIDRPVALVAVSEKGYLDVRVEVTGAGGHASMPPRRSVTGGIARAVAAIEDSPFPKRLCPAVRGFLGDLAPYCRFAYRLLFRNLWLTAPLVKWAFSATPDTNALLRTTAAPTMVSGSRKENVLADIATANINVRVLPGDSSVPVMERLRKIVAPFGATVAVAHPEALVEPLPESATDHEGYRAIRNALSASFPEAGCAPFLLAGGTDTKHYREVAQSIYRFSPLRQTRADLTRVHGRDEHVEVANLRKCELFYASLIGSL